MSEEESAYSVEVVTRIIYFSGVKKPGVLSESLAASEINIGGIVEECLCFEACCSNILDEARRLLRHDAISSNHHICWCIVDIFEIVIV